MIISSCKSTTVVKSNRSDSHGYHVESIHVGKANKRQKQIVEEAYTWLGTPYIYAGAEKGKGTDCSGMVMEVYQKVTGAKIPRNSAKQAEYCESIDEENVSTGDLVFFATGKDKDRISHVGIIVDSNSFIHASSSKGVVVSDLKNPYYIRTFKMFGRVPK
ncbi:MAG: C40 family peptidase [Candidatus Amulumruptor caecigallinarius]|nr:C40 family peptidase [Candidatus Amulumruptor caecigallinarius]